MPVACLALMVSEDTKYRILVLEEPCRQKAGWGQKVCSVQTILACPVTKRSGEKGNFLVRVVQFTRWVTVVGQFRRRENDLFGTLDVTQHLLRVTA